jgi:DNA-binding CsgD family transcriptional regulator
MSHLTQFSNNSLVNTNKDRLEKSLKEIGVTLDYNNRTIKNQWIEDTVDAAFIVDGKRIAAGINFKMVDGKETVEVNGDFYGTGLNQKTLTNQIAQVYQKNDVIAKCKSQRWFIDNEKDIKANENGDIVIQAYRYV